MYKDFDQSLGNICEMSPKLLQRYFPKEEERRNVGAVLAAQKQAGCILAREEISDKPVLGQWEKVITYLHIRFAHSNREEARILFLDRRNVLITDEKMWEGSIDHTPVYPREIVFRALELGASAVILAHNHPSNRPEPNGPDIEMTRQVRDALSGVGVVLHDHIIISKKGYASFRQRGLLGG